MKLKGVWRDLLKFLFAKLREEIYFRLSLILCIDPVSNKLRSSLLKLLKAFISKLLREFHFYFFRIFYTRRLLLVFVCHPQICKSGYEKLTDKYFELLICLYIWANERFLSGHVEYMNVVRALIILNQVQGDMMCKVWLASSNVANAFYVHINLTERWEAYQFFLFEIMCKLFMLY